jgi:nitroreductase
LADSVFAHSGEPDRWAQYDTGAASLSIALQAVALGLAAHQMGGFDAARLAREFNVPERFTPMAMIAVGYRGEPDMLPPDLKERELAPRKRRQLAETFFAGQWGEPATAE